ncbi:selenoneine biosynthesis selenosugar synthase SenB [Ramlibacter sp. PS4R-6]|uniref:selenoneine biosynthesis selenosugar synthase SenB n=1 Tax=Ramlibacter sp. PS4R-6 TaxID=3133438 RepID=UPI0030972FEE
MPSPSVVIVSPALAAANNGNWQTAARWASFLRPRYPVRIVDAWPDAGAAGDELMIALHARRSATAIAAWVSVKPPGRIALVLTGTDLYRDIRGDAGAQRSLDLAQSLVVLQELGLSALPARHRSKSRAIYQSVTPRRALSKSGRTLRAVMVGHLREVKSPQTLFDAAGLLRARTDIEIHHIGRAEEPVWAERARAAQAACPNYRWLGALPHNETRDAIQRAHVLVHTSAMEGGAHVIMEAVCSGTPVIASRVDGNVGMLGADYGGYFPHGDAAALARLLEAARDTQAGDDPSAALLARLRAQCALRAPLFAPETERAAVLQLVRELEESA